MADNVQKTILEYVVSGLQQMQTMAAAVEKLSASNTALSSTLGQISRSAKGYDAALKLLTAETVKGAAATTRYTATVDALGASATKASTSLSGLQTKLASINRAAFESYGILQKTVAQYDAMGLGVSASGKAFKSSGAGYFNVNQALGAPLPAQVTSKYDAAMASLGVSTYNTNSILARASNTLQNVTTSTTRATDAANKFTLAWSSVSRIAIGSLIARGVGMLIRSFEEGIQKANEFNIRIGEIRTISQHSQQSFDSWGNSVRRLSDAFGMPILDVAEAHYQALSNQIAEGAGVTDFAREANRLAIITVSSLTDAVEALSGVLKSYNLTVGDAREQSNMLFKAVELGRFRLEEVADTIGSVTVVASQLGVKVEEVYTTLSVLTIQGMNVSRAMTGLRTLMLKLIRPSDYLKEIFKEMGVSSAEEAIRFYGFTGFMKLLGERAKETGSELSEFADQFQRINAITGASGAFGSKSINTYEEFLDEIKNSTKSADTAFQEMMNNVGIRNRREIERIKNLFTKDLGQTLLISFDNLNNAIGGVAERLKNLGSVVEAVAVGMLANSMFNLTQGVGSLSQVLPKLIAMLSSVRTWFIAVSIASYKATSYVLDFWTRFEKTNDELMTSETQAWGEKEREKFRITEEFVSKTEKAWVDSVHRNLQSFREMLAKAKGALDKDFSARDKQRGLADILFNIDMERASKDPKAQEALLKKRLAELEVKGLSDVGLKDFEAFGKTWSEAESLLSKLKDLQEENRKKFGLSTTEFRTNADGTITLIERSASRAYAVITNLSQEQAEIMKRTLGKSAQEIENSFRSMISGELSADIQKNGNQLNAPLERRKELLDSIVEKEKEWAVVEQRIAEVAQYRKTQADTANINIIEIEKQLKTVRENLPLLSQPISGAGGFILPPSYKEAKIPGLDEAQALLKDPAAMRAADPYAVAKLVSQVTASIRASAQLANLPSLSTAAENLDKYAAEAVQALQESNKAVLHIDLLKNESQEIINAKAKLEEFKALFNNSVVLSWDKIQQDALTTKAAWDSLEPTLQKIKSLLDYINSSRPLPGQPYSIPQTNPSSLWKGGYIQRFANGGVVGMDSIHGMFRQGEMVMNTGAVAKFMPQLIAMNSKAARFNSGGVVNNNVGDINVTVQGASTPDVSARRVAEALRRELRRGTVRLN